MLGITSKGYNIGFYVFMVKGRNLGIFSYFPKMIKMNFSKKVHILKFLLLYLVTSEISITKSHIMASNFISGMHLIEFSQ